MGEILLYAQIRESSRQMLSYRPPLGLGFAAPCVLYARKETQDHDAEDDNARATPAPPTEEAPTSPILRRWPRPCRAQNERDAQVSIRSTLALEAECATATKAHVPVQKYLESFDTSNF